MRIIHLCLSIILVSHFSWAEEMSAEPAAESTAGGLSIDLNGGLGILQTKLDGNGFAGEMPSSNGTSYGTNIRYTWAVENVDLGLKYNHASADFDGPSTVTPRSVQMDRDQYSLYSTVGIGDSFRLGAGYSMVNYAVDEQSPNLVTEQQSHGLSVFVEDSFYFNEKFYSTLNLEIYVPGSLTERPVQSGFNPKYLGLELGYFLFWQKNEDISFYLGASYRQDSVHFDGEGGRGTVDAIDTRTYINVPVGLRWFFN